MSLEQLRDVLFWCLCLNLAVLVVGFWLLMLPHTWLYRLWGRWVRLPPEQFEAINYAALALYKVGIILFNVVPYVALRIVG